MTLGVLQAVDAEDYDRLLFVPRPALRIVESQFPIFAIWHANQPACSIGQRDPPGCGREPRAADPAQ